MSLLPPVFPCTWKPLPSSVSRKSQIGTKQKVNRVLPHRMVELLGADLKEPSEPLTTKQSLLKRRTGQYQQRGWKPAELLIESHPGFLLKKHFCTVLQQDESESQRLQHQLLLMLQSICWTVKVTWFIIITQLYWTGVQTPRRNCSVSTHVSHWQTIPENCGRSDWLKLLPAGQWGGGAVFLAVTALL